ncbi:MAG: enoyl-CoA hydratase/isomerase family protein [Candidatus Koribacter versatilis]|uniref:Enoyl-CoA hydratase/isomerase family protein n=1 Tax=Candidatus Korobacter versatilis TaxID=658062 RepID=A0A932A6X5_9BACT|nr:enoyl-CoA hydratase/isomerase family protein [Candidatus Koribacter versatilis]
MASPVARVTLANRSQNVIDIEMMEELRAALTELEARSDVSAIVFRGGEKAFSAGVDIAAHTPDKVAGMLEKFHAVVRAMVASKKVLVAEVRGNCLGGGAEMALVCDIVITADDAQWGFPEITLACYPPVACVALAAAVGQKRAAELILTGKTISGAEAERIGLANVVCGARQVEARSRELTSRLSELSPAALALTKKALYMWDAVHFDKGLARAEKIYLDELVKTADCSEGIAAWMEKRKARWSH